MLYKDFSAQDLVYPPDNSQAFYRAVNPMKHCLSGKWILSA